MFWHWLWVDNERPRHGHVAAVMRKTRATYHYAVRHIKRRERELRKSKMAESVSTNKQSDIWVETKKMLSGKKPSINSVDGACNPEAISEVFASKYETLFQGTPTEPAELQSLYRTIKSGVTADDRSYSSITVNDVADALKDIKLGKRDGKYSLSSDHLVNSSRRFLIILSILMSSMLVHGYNAADLLSSTIISIPKNARGDMSQSDNYRGIALCNCICKLFDIILMKKCSDVLCTSDQQFAFKANHSTTLCSGLLIETANHFVNNNSCVYSCFLDASKAFDKVHYGKLFNLMLKRNVPSVIVRFILDGYIRECMCAQWERYKSRIFYVRNGVKQGAVISPILFAVYYDELIAKLASSGYGCRIAQHFVGALSYADDITLLSPSLQGLQYMVNICEEYGKEFHVTFNDKKTIGMVFGASNVDCKAIQVNGNNVTWATNAKHLGNVVDHKLSDLNDINAKKGYFIASVNWFVGHFRGKVPIDCYIRLFQSYCSTHYSSTLWALHDKWFNDFCVTWNKGVRRILNVSYMTHTAFLGQLINTCHISIQLVKRFCKFVDLMLTSRNAIVRHFVRRAINSAQSPIGRNIAVIRHRYAIYVLDINVNHVLRQCLFSQPELTGIAWCILELLRVSNNEIDLPGFTKTMLTT